MTGFMWPCLFSMWHIIVMGTPPHFHSATGAVRLVTEEIKPVHIRKKSTDSTVQFSIWGMSVYRGNK